MARRPEPIAFDGDLLRLRVTPRAAAEAIAMAPCAEGETPLALVRVAAPAEGGKANAAVIALAAKALGVPKSALTIVRGETGRDKLLRIDRR